jgi:hypothetical protein
MLHTALIDVWSLFRQKLFCLENSYESHPYLWLGNVGGSGGSSTVPVLSDADSDVEFRVGSVGARLDREHSNCLGPDVSVSNTHK